MKGSWKGKAHYRDYYPKTNSFCLVCRHRGCSDPTYDNCRNKKKSLKKNPFTKERQDWTYIKSRCKNWMSEMF